MANRDGKRKFRSEIAVCRKLSLGYYLIATDAKETECNFLTGLRDSIPETLRKNISIKILRNVDASKIVSTVIEEASLNPQYSECWIVMDRDKVPNFDELMFNAEKEKINVGWSNPCIEIMFLAYWGSMPNFQSSVQCVQAFKKEYRNKTGLEYEKSQKDIYSKLHVTGDETMALKIADTRYKNSISIYRKPSEMLSTTKLYQLIQEIRSKIDR